MKTLPINLDICTVVVTLAGRYVVVRAGETLGEFHCEVTALQTAAALNNGPVAMVGVARWDSLKAGHQTEEEAA